MADQLASDLQASCPQLYAILNQAYLDDLNTILAAGDLTKQPLHRFLTHLEAYIGKLEAEATDTALELQNAQNRLSQVESSQKAPSDNANHLQQVQTQLQLANNRFKEATRTIDQLQQQLIKTNALLVDKPVASNVTHLPREKADGPKHFSGNDSDLRKRNQQFKTWRAGLTFKFNQDGPHYPTEQSRLIYAASRLEGRAAGIAADIPRQLEKNTALEHWQFQTVESLVTALQTAFGIANSRSQAESDLLSMAMKSSTWPEFYSKFTEAHAELSYDGYSKVSQLKSKVSDELASAAAAQVPGPADNDFDGWAKLYTTLWENQQSLKARNKHLLGPSYRSSPPSSAVLPVATGDPMQLDATTFRPKLTQDQRQYRRTNNLCMYCGDPCSDTHYAEICPKKSTSQAGRGRSRGTFPAISAAPQWTPQSSPNPFGRGRGYGRGNPNLAYGRGFNASSSNSVSDWNDTISSHSAWSAHTPAQYHHTPNLAEPGFILPDPNTTKANAPNTQPSKD